MKFCAFLILRLNSELRKNYFSMERLSFGLLFLTLLLKQRQFVYSNQRLTSNHDAFQYHPVSISFFSEFIKILHRSYSSFSDCLSITKN